LKILQDAAIFLLLIRPTVHTKTARKRELLETLFKTKKYQNRPSLRFGVDGKHFENEVFRKQEDRDDHVISLPEFFSSTDPQLPVIMLRFQMSPE